MKRIELTRGLFAIVDDEDYEELNRHNWYAMLNHGNDYATRQGRVSVGKQRAVYMHRVVSGAPKGKVVDHLNGDTLDNRKSNLRVVAQRENVRNHPRPHVGRRPSGNWMATLCHDNYKKYLGVFPTKELAIAAWLRAKIAIHGTASSTRAIAVYGHLL